MLKPEILYLHKKETPRQLPSSEYCKIFKFMLTPILKNIIEMLLLSEVDLFQ